MLRFLCGTARLRPACHARVPAWDEAIVLESLSMVRFETNVFASDEFRTLKMTFLLAIIQLFKELKKCCLLEFRACSLSRPGYVPKVPTNVARSTQLR